MISRSENTTSLFAVALLIGFAFLVVAALSSLHHAYRFMEQESIQPSIETADWNEKSAFDDSTRYALSNGPKSQRLDIILHLEDQGRESKMFLNHLRALVNDSDPDIAKAAKNAADKISVAK